MGVVGSEQTQLLDNYWSFFIKPASTTLTSEDPKSANKSSTSWQCPEYAYNFNGNDITVYQGISTWQECGDLCHKHKACSHWTWNVPRASSHHAPYLCYLKYSDHGHAFDGQTIS